MTTDVFPFYGTIQQCWDVIYSEYHRLAGVYGCEPFFFEFPRHKVIHEYSPQDGELIYFEIRDSDNKDALIHVEVEPKPGDARQLNIFIHAHTNTFQEPGKAAIEVWKQIENTMHARGHLTEPAAFHAPSSQIYLPSEPPPGSDPFIWLDWRLEMIKSGGKCTLEQIAPKIPLSASRLRYLHRNYKNQRGLPNHYERQYKTRYKK